MKTRKLLVIFISLIMTVGVFTACGGDGSTRISAISGGGSFTLALDEGGGLWAWDNNDSGQLGNGSEPESEIPGRVHSYAPIQIKKDTEFKAVSAGGCHSLAIDKDGSLWAWGGGGMGQLGNGKTKNTDISLRIKV